MKPATKQISRSLITALCCLVALASAACTKERLAVPNLAGDPPFQVDRETPDQLLKEITFGIGVVLDAERALRPPAKGAKANISLARDKGRVGLGLVEQAALKLANTPRGDTGASELQMIGERIEHRAIFFEKTFEQIVELTRIAGVGQEALIREIDKTGGRLGQYLSALQKTPGSERDAALQRMAVSLEKIERARHADRDDGDMRFLVALGSGVRAIRAELQGDHFSEKEAGRIDVNLHLYAIFSERYVVNRVDLENWSPLLDAQADDILRIVFRHMRNT